MALTQMQQIQSLGEALAWLERELAWGVPASTLAHLCGRIGELYACVITNGQMALNAHQRGYDVVSNTGERVSVKTTTKRPPCRVAFNPNTLNETDRIIVLRINTEDMQVETLFDTTTDIARAKMRAQQGGKLILPLHSLPSSSGKDRALAEVRYASHDSYRVSELENGSIQVWSLGKRLDPVKPVLRELAKSLGVSEKNGRGNELNTRQLGTRILDFLQHGWGHLPSMPAPGEVTNAIG